MTPTETGDFVGRIFCGDCVRPLRIVVHKVTSSFFCGFATMATEWYFYHGDQELGPISFSDLVNLVRVGVVTEQALVRPSWNEKTQRADSVVGLMYMSRQKVTESEVSPATPGVETSTDTSHGIDKPAPPPRPEWLERLLELRDTTFHTTGQPRGSTAHDAETDSSCLSDESGSPEELMNPELNESDFAEVGGVDDQDPSVMSPGRASHWDETMHAALSQVDLRDRKTALSRTTGWRVAAAIINSVRYAVESREFLGRTFRIGSAIVVANLAAFWVLNWSERQALRFPARHGSTQISTTVFPLIGQCSSTEYWILSAHLVLICGAGGYGVASYLEARADG